MAQHAHHFGPDIEPDEAIVMFRHRREARVFAVIALLVTAALALFVGIYMAYMSGANAGM